jgi:hypothetical protein
VGIQILDKSVANFCIQLFTSKGVHFTKEIIMSADTFPVDTMKKFLTAALQVPSLQSFYFRDSYCRLGWDPILRCLAHTLPQASHLEKLKVRIRPFPWGL